MSLRFQGVWPLFGKCSYFPFSLTRREWRRNNRTTESPWQNHISAKDVHVNRITDIFVDAMEHDPLTQYLFRYERINRAICPVSGMPPYGILGVWHRLYYRKSFGRRMLDIPGQYSIQHYPIAEN
jgi:hypothetical protein